MSEHSDGWISTGAPQGVSDWGRRTFASVAREMDAASDLDDFEELRIKVDRLQDPAIQAGLSLLLDLAAQGWLVDVDRGRVRVHPPDSADDPTEEKARVRKLELLKRDEQLRKPSVRRFIESMETPREHNGRFVSIFNLIRDGSELAGALESAIQSGIDLDSLRSCIDPYLEIVDASSRCAYTGLRLMDIWRYFRHTWITQYSTTPGRTLMILVRDRAAPDHPVVGIAAVASPIVQISERDAWIGWLPETRVEAMRQAPSSKDAQWIMSCLDGSLNETHLDDLIADSLYWPDLWNQPSEDAIADLRAEAKLCRARHARFTRPSVLKSTPTSDSWRARAESDLFRSKRCALLADLLSARAALLPYLTASKSKAALTKALDDRGARKAISGVVRRAKAASVGTAMADLSVCGAVPPYSPLLGGKLVSMLSVSPTVVRAYREKYAGAASEIASSMAGRPVHRAADLAYIGTTSLFGSGSSQYNRVRVPAHVLSGGEKDLRFLQIGRSRSFGTSHLSKRTTEHLVTLIEQQAGGQRVNSIFGEGVNPKMRKVREGIECLGWPSASLLQHGRSRLVFGVPLVENLLPFLLGADARPRYLFDAANPDDVAQISSYWCERWLAGRCQRQDVMAAVATHTVGAASTHGAIVSLPPLKPVDRP